MSACADGCSGIGERSPSPRRSRLEIRGSTAGIELRQRGPPPPGPLPRRRGRGGEFDPAATRFPAVLPPPRSLWGRVGEGGGVGRSPMLVVDPPSVGNPNLPQQFWGRW